MKTASFKRITQSLGVVALVTFGSSAFATSTWNLSACSGGQNLGSAITCAVPGGAAGLALSGLSNGTGTSGSPNATSNAAKFAAGTIYDWDPNGLGIVSGNETSTPNGPHAIDNGYGIDALRLNFTGGPVNMTGLSIGWNATDSNSTTDNNGASSGGGTAVTYKDSDLSVFAWIGATGKTATSAVSPTDLMAASSGWSLIGNYADVGAQTNNAQGLSSGIYSSYWLISAYSNAYGAGSGLNKGDDAFKLLTVAGNTCSDTLVGTSCVPVTPGNGVPEPGSLALLGLGLVGLVASRRRGLKAA